MTQFRYWIVAIAIIVILVIWGMLYHDDMQAQKKAEMNVIKPAVAQMTHGKFMKVTSFREHDVNGVHMMSTVAKVKIGDKFSFYHMDFKNVHGHWVMTDFKAFHPG